MNISWGYSPKIEKYVPLGDFPPDKYLIIAKQAIGNLGWKLSHISSTGLIAYTPISFQSYSEEITIRIDTNFAIIKSECVGIQMLFNDYGKNALNLDKFFHELAYVEFHLKDIWEESLTKFHEFIATQDDDYFEKAPLTVKNKIKNVLFLFFPQKGYVVAPLLVIVNVIYYFIFVLLLIVMIRYLGAQEAEDIRQKASSYIGANSRDLVLSGQYWRLITHQFVHWSFMHLFFNMYALVYIGLMIEHKLGGRKFLFVYLLSGICGGLVSLVTHEVGFMAGASGSIMGLFGAFSALLLSKAFEKNATKALFISTIIVTIFMLLNGIRGRTDNSAHIGGLVAGFVICYIVFNEKLVKWTIKPIVRYGLSTGLVLIFSAAVLSLTPQYQYKEFEILQHKFTKNSAEFSDVYSIPSSYSKKEKLKIIKESGLDIWADNARIVKKMQALNLNKSQSAKVEFYAKITAKTTKISVLLYRECQDNNYNYRGEIRSLSYDINDIRLEEGERLRTEEN
ncbi:rhomboid family intramembrane serine protease [Pedobacter frigiditerrae]|uniref:Rhomboid family intramembrane serine protease n=1 Tax=Pedobacter frigiditerrae TaxID=2530452 RepID=A0A4R0N302_9SPHI|nr:rhomboid family intramembrane serine protease [Pedobacter frigiditerrae]TCC94115.1 rhomboid family intramembrane serine protease [Pedobacter frigiditerrae]